MSSNNRNVIYSCDCVPEISHDGRICTGLKLVARSGRPGNDLYLRMLQSFDLLLTTFRRPWEKHAGPLEFLAGSSKSARSFVDRLVTDEIATPVSGVSAYGVSEDLYAFKLDVMKFSRRLCCARCRRIFPHTRMLPVKATGLPMCRKCHKESVEDDFDLDLDVSFDVDFHTGERKE